MRKKLIEVALPLDAINKASAREKSIRHGHPSTLHLWWARRPLATARAVIFAQMVDAPSEYVDVLLSDPRKRSAAQRELRKRNGGKVIPSVKHSLESVIAEQERDRLCDIIEELVVWENSSNERVVQRARDEIWQSWRRACAENVDHPRASQLFNRHALPGFHDPFAGGGALPLEAQRLGLKSWASDLNPVAVLINKAMIEIPPTFAGRPPVNPKARQDDFTAQRTWIGAQGLAEDVRYYGRWMRDEAERRIGHLYPKVEITADMAQERPDLARYKGRSLTVIAWLWVRTVKSPNPAFAHVHVPLAPTFMLSSVKDKEAYVEPVLEDGGYRFTVKTGLPADVGAVKAGAKAGRGANFRCLLSGTPITPDYIKNEGTAGRMDARLMAIVAEGDMARVYVAPIQSHEMAIHDAKSPWKPDLNIASGYYIGVRRYGMERYYQLFTERQLTALCALSDAAAQAQAAVREHAATAEKAADGVHLRDGGTGPTAYAEAIAVYLAFIIDKVADYGSNICTWNSSRQQIRNVFARQVIPMTWDYAESNGLSNSTGSITNMNNWIYKVISKLPAKKRGSGANQGSAQAQTISKGRVISTDPPYYDNVPYADLSDFFYVWLRKSLRAIFPQLLATIAVPKGEELVAFAHRHDGKQADAEEFFLDGMTLSMRRLAELAHEAFPVTIHYGFKQSETQSAEGQSSTGWETFLEAVVRAGFAVTGTWPIRTERKGRLRAIGSSALTTSIVLVCRRLQEGAQVITRRRFVAELKSELSPALALQQRANIAPVDLAQAAIGPGMAVFTRYAKVLDVEGNALTVRAALVLINKTLDEALAEQEGDYDTDSRWALAWFEQFGFEEGEYGTAELLSKAKNTSIRGLVEAGILHSSRGKVQLLRPKALPDGWDPQTDERRSAWETLHHLVKALETAGESGAADLAAKLGADAEASRELCYRLYNLCERKQRALEGRSYNALVQSWPEIMRLADERRRTKGSQGSLFEQEDA